MKRTLVTLGIGLLLAAGAVRAENWCQWFDPSCQVFGYVNVKGVRDVPMVNELINGQDNISRFMSTIRQWTAIDLDSVTDVWFGIAGKDDAVVVVQGKYNLSVIRGAIGAVETFRITTPEGAEFAVMLPDEKNPGKVNMVAFLTDTIVLVGRPARVEAVMENRAAEQKHPRSEELAALEKPSHLLECLLFSIPNDKGDVPPFITENLALARITGDADENADVSIAIQPVKPEMIAPMCKLAEGLLELYDKVPPEQVRLDPIREALLSNATVSATPRAAVFGTRLPLAMVRSALAAKLGTPVGQ